MGVSLCPKRDVKCLFIYKYMYGMTKAVCGYSVAQTLKVRVYLGERREEAIKERQSCRYTPYSTEILCWGWKRWKEMGGGIGRRDKRRGECEMTGVGQGEESREGGRVLTLPLKLHALITQRTLMGKGTARKWLEREVYKGLEWSKLEVSCKCSLETS